MSKPLDETLKPGAALPSASDQEIIIKTLTEYKIEAVNHRKTGPNPRDDKWQQNLDLYWNRYDFSDKANWQSKNVMPEVPSYVDRLTAALKEALTMGDFYDVVDPYDTERDLAQSIKNMNDVWLTQTGMSPNGTPLDFSAVFEEQMKMGSLMACAAIVNWRTDVPGGRVSVETVDPRNVWVDHTYRNLYRIRSTEVDKVELGRMLGMRTPKGNPLFNLDELDRLLMNRHIDEQLMQKEELTGGGEQISSSRRPVKMDEYIATIMAPDGRMLADHELMVMADDQFLIRGPEKIPYKHGKDFLVFSPLVTVPLSPYGRSYMEDFGSIAKVFTDLTNLILDASYTGSMNAIALVPSMLMDSTQANDGVWPNKTFYLEEGYSAKDFAAKLELGTLSGDSITIWQTLKNELAEASGMNEIGLGQLPEKTHIAATAVAGAQQSSSQMLRSLAQTIETRFLDPILDLVWKTGLQHVKIGDRRMAAAVGADMFGALVSQRDELITRPYTFQARGISGMIIRQQKLNSLLQIIQIIAQNENLVATFMQRVDMNKLIDLLFDLSNVDLQKMSISQRQAAIRQVAAPLEQAAQRGQPTGAAQEPMGDIANTLGVAKQ